MVDKFHLYIEPFQEERMIQVYLPQGYDQTDQRYPVLYMHDGQNVFRDEEAVGGVSLDLEAYLDENNVAVIVVAIDSVPVKDQRVDEYCPWVNGEFCAQVLGAKSTLGGKGGAYAEFIVQEIKPLIDSKYRTLADRTAMAGISLGGLMTVYAVCRYPHIFTRAAAISSGFYRNQEDIEAFVSQSDLSSVERMYADYGTREGGDALCDIFMASNAAVYERMRPKLSNLKVEIIPDAEHNYTAFRKRVPAIMSYLFSS